MPSYSNSFSFNNPPHLCMYVCIDRWTDRYIEMERESIYSNWTIVKYISTCMSEFNQECIWAWCLIRIDSASIFNGLRQHDNIGGHHEQSLIKLPIMKKGIKNIVVTQAFSWQSTFPLEGWEEQVAHSSQDYSPQMVHLRVLTHNDMK